MIGVLQKMCQGVSVIPKSAMKCLSQARLSAPVTGCDFVPVQKTIKPPFQKQQPNQSMRKQFIRLTSAALVLLAGVSGQSQSAYFQAVTNLNPVVYFPLQDMVQPPIADVESN